MLDLIIVIVFCWLFFKALGLTFRVAWGLTKFIASLLFVLALPMLILGLIFASGVVLLIPLALVGIAFAMLKAIV